MELSKLNKQIISNLLTFIFPLVLMFLSKIIKTGEIRDWKEYVTSDVIISIFSALLVIVFTRWIEDIKYFIIPSILCGTSAILYVFAYCFERQLPIVIITLICFVVFVFAFIADIITLRKNEKKKLENGSLQNVSINQSISRDE